MANELTDFSVSEQATPYDPSQFTGGFGQLSYTKLSTPEDFQHLYSWADIDTDRYGHYQGIVETIESSNGLTTFSANAETSVLNRNLSVPPRKDTLESYSQWIFQLCGSNVVPVVDDSIKNLVVSVPGYVGNVWDNFRQLGAIYDFDINQIESDVVIRPMSHVTSTREQETSRTVSATTNSSANHVMVYWYDSQWNDVTSQELSFEEEDSLQSPLTVDAGEILEQEFRIEGSLFEVAQPVCYDYVSPDTVWTGSAGGYCVSGNDGKPITAAQWTSTGGSISVEIGDDPSVVVVKIQAPDDETYAPYHIAATAGTSSFYNSLHLCGWGFTWEKNSVTLNTGSISLPNVDNTPTEFDSRLVMSLASAYKVATRISRDLGGGIPSVSGECLNLVLEGQTFGNTIGSRIRLEDAWFRVQSMETSPSGISYTLEMDTRVSDFDEFLVSLGVTTVEEFDHMFKDRVRVMDFDNTCLNYNLTGGGDIVPQP